MVLIIFKDFTRTAKINQSRHSQKLLKLSSQAGGSFKQASGRLKQSVVQYPSQFQNYLVKLLKFICIKSFPNFHHRQGKLQTSKRPFNISCVSASQLCSTPHAKFHELSFSVNSTTIRINLKKNCLCWYNFVVILRNKE